MAISADVKLDIYNDALTHLESRLIASLSENREPRRVLDQYWGANDKLVRFALQQGDWNFATRTTMLSYDTAVTPAFGLSYAFAKPTDFKRLISIASDERFESPLLARIGYVDEAGFWYSDLQDLYLRYVSDGDTYGFSSGQWTETFRNYLSFRLAWLACKRITGKEDMKLDLEKGMDKALAEARSINSMNEGTKMPRPGNWARSRGSISSRFDRATSITP